SSRPGSQPADPRKMEVPMTTTPSIVRPVRPGGRLFDRFAREVTSHGLPTGPGDARPVGDADLAGLPLSVQRYLRFMGVVGQPRAWSFRAHFVGRFRLRRAWDGCPRR